jgi:signal transduction histidine kinase
MQISDKSSCRNGGQPTNADGGRRQQADVDETHRMINRLSPSARNQLSLVAAIRQLLAELQERYGVECIFVEDVYFSRLTAPLEASIFRTVQEGLSNAIRHSGSPTVLVGLNQRGLRLSLKIKDWGSGFAPEIPRGPSSTGRPGAMPPSRRAINGLLEWVDEAQASQRTWAQRALVVIGTIVVVLWLMLRFGLLLE